MGAVEKRRCEFQFGGKPYPVTEKYLVYHDTRWGKPLHDDRELFAMLILEGMQAGVSWNLILEKEDNFRRAFDGFDPAVVAMYDENKVESLMQEFLKVQEEFGSFDAYIWSFTDGQVVDHRLHDGDPMPAKDELSERVSKDLKKRGFKFVGPVIIYSYLQGIGVINDHSVTCEYR